MEFEQRSCGALTGWFTGDGFGSQTDGMDRQQVETLSQGPISDVYTFESVTEGCGVSSLVSDLPVLLALSVQTTGTCDIDHIRSSYRRYLKDAREPWSDRVRQALEQKGGAEDHAMALGRVVMWALLMVAQDKRFDSRLVAEETNLTHVSPLAGDAVVLLSQALALLVTDDLEDKQEFHRRLVAMAGKQSLDPRIIAELNAVRRSTSDRELVYPEDSVLTSIRLVLSTFLHAQDIEEGMDQIARRGGCARINCALYGALVGAAEGPGAIPERWVDELCPSASLERYIKRQTLSRREQIRMDRLAARLTDGLLKQLGGS